MKPAYAHLRPVNDAPPIPAVGEPPHELEVRTIYREHARFVWLSLQRLGIHPSDLDDIAQDVFMIVHKRLDSYRRDAKLSAWLYGICLRCVARHRRRAFRRRERPEGIAQPRITAGAAAGPTKCCRAASRTSGPPR